MAQISDGPSQNRYFIVSSFNNTLKAGKNSLLINPTNFAVPTANINFSAYDGNGNILDSGVIKPTDAKFAEETKTGYFYYVNVPATVPPGVGRIEISSVGLDVGEYTGNIAYFNNRAYKISHNQRLPLTQAPETASLSQIKVLWSSNVLIDPTKKTDTEVRFFDSPKIEVRSQVYDCPDFPTASYVVASGSFSSVAVFPKNNADGDFDYQYDKPIYQMYWNSGTKFSGSMEGEYVRIKNPSIKNFRYSDYRNNQIVFEGVLSTDFIAKIDQVVNETTLLLNIPFSTVAEIIGRTNQDSPYAKNNLTDIKRYGTSNDSYKQTTFHKKNFFVLSIDGGEYEIIHKNINPILPRAVASGSITHKKSIIEIDFTNIRVLSGDLDYYKIYGKSLNSPETKTLISEGKIKSENLMSSFKFDNGLYNSVGEFYNSTHLSKYWLTSGGGITFSQSHEVLINGATISHTGNSSETDYVIFKDDTSSGRTGAYISPTLLSNSHWYGRSDAFISDLPYPTGSYSNIKNAPPLFFYVNSQENLLSGAIHDSNPINLKQNALYEFSMIAKPAPSNTSNSVLNVYFLSGADRIKIGYIDSNSKFIPGKKYKNTFYSDVERFGTIILVPIQGSWSISKISIVPHQAVDYSIDTFKIKIPIKPTLKNELYEIEAEFYDAGGQLAYGTDSYTFLYNKKFLPLKKQVFLDPSGITFGCECTATLPSQYTP